MREERKQPRPRFRGLQLSQEDQQALRRREREGPLGMLVARRVQALRLLDKGWTITQAAEATGTYRREVRRVANRFLEGGVEHALSEESRRRRSKLLDSVQTAALIAMVCGPPPEGRARWTIALVTDEAERRKIVRSVSRETIRRTLADQDIKPWREKNVVRSQDQRAVRRADEGRAGAVRPAPRPERTSRSAR
ncbi:helix-turn-helix domain-containing protein [Sorangium sp. So ce367]|uniref:helix-turn-helix domain-containing protein n=1 Tax=Sorangium sp. So ce367 TaxID=3133305 RepID=UPI003F612752